ncbi:hypothetical protein BDF14DRAFT_1875404 [Spinellus fusiger]|nr:hypothetical protein BDF14DRAFT_1875404 [Spinellus fusiger]
MDPYDLDTTLPDEELGQDDIQKLDELAPKGPDYYGILNVSRTANDEEIKEAYKKLCRFFHPDKHTADDMKKIAEARFQGIQEAYEVLTNAQKRIIYDTYGEQGLTATWEVGARFKTTDEMREEYEKQERRKREKTLESLVQARTNVQLTLDVSQVLDPYEPPVFSFQKPHQQRQRRVWDTLGNIKADALVMRHSFHTQVGPQTYLIMGGSIATRSGMGGGNLVGTLRHTVSPKLWGQLSVTCLSPRTFTLKTCYNLSTDSFVNTTVNSQSLEAPPVLSVTMGRRLFTSTTGYLTYNTGEWALGPWGTFDGQEKSSVTVGMASAHKQGNYSMELQTGLQASHIAGEYSHKLPNRVRLQFSSSLSSATGISVSLGSGHKITEHVQCGMTLECGLYSGVMVKLRASRLGQKFTLPIVLSHGLDLKTALGAFFVPTTLVLALEYVFLAPRRRAALKEKLVALREEHRDYLEARKQEALDAQYLMQEIGDRKRRQEERKEEGLVITQALYGHLEALNDSSDSDQVIDVTGVVQTLVNESRLTIPGGHSKVISVQE